MASTRETGESERLSQLLADWAAQDPQALDRLVPIVYDELRRLAHHYMHGERAATRCRPRRSSTRSTCGWRESRAFNGAIAHTFSRWPGR